MNSKIHTKKDALARYKMRVAAARSRFELKREEIFQQAKEIKLGELKKKISQT